MENQIPSSSAKSSGIKPIIIIVISFIFGSLGGVYGPGILSNTFKIQGIKQTVQNSQGFKEIKLTEESAVIDVVKTAGPAVVSVVISKDISKYKNYSFDPFGFDPFGDFFGNGSQNSPNQSQPSKPDVQKVGAGSGFFVSSDGLIITNKHVVSDTEASYTVIISDGKEYEAKVQAIDPRNDIALIKIEIKNAPFLVLSDSSQIQVGQRVVAIGNSLGQYQNTVTTGVVSGIGRSITAGSNDGSEQLDGVIQTDAAINPGNSGGPLLNSASQVIGINTAIDRQGQLVGFAIPANDARKAIESFTKSGKISRPYLGVRYTMISKELAQKEKLPKDYGALILRGEQFTDFAVSPGSPADKAGLMENDIILEVNGKKLQDDYTLSRAIKDVEVGDVLNLKFYHKGEEKSITVILAESK